MLPAPASNKRHVEVVVEYLCNEKRQKTEWDTFREIMQQNIEFLDQSVAEYGCTEHAPLIVCTPEAARYSGKHFKGAVQVYRMLLYCCYGSFCHYSGPGTYMLLLLFL